jgi:signal transduction histidine kinase
MQDLSILFAMGGELDFRLLFEEAPDVLLVLLPDTPKFTMVAATRARYAATQTTPEQTIGVGLFELFPDNPDDATATGSSYLRSSLERVLETRAPDTMAVQKYDVRDPDGNFQVKYWSPKNIPVLSPDGEVSYILHRVEDVTELVRASELGTELVGRTRAMEREVLARSRELADANSNLRDANTKLAELDAAKTVFFSNVSHEFRTPLTLILSPLEDLLTVSNEGLSEPHRARIKIVHDNALRLLKLVNTLLDFARIEAGRMRANYAPLDLSTHTAELAAMFHSATEKGGLALRIDCAPLSERVWVDREMWEKIVPNLVSNAFKFTLSGEIAVRLREEQSNVVLEVSDTGVGIPESALSRIFERFHRVEGSKGRTHEGTGIGLSLVRELVRLHGGDVSVQSELGKGTSFRVVIPKGFAHLPPDAVSHESVQHGSHTLDAAAHAADASRWVSDTIYEERSAHPPQVAVASSARAHVLVVDDNATLREYIANLLGPIYRVTVAVDGAAALVAIAQELPDLVVSDVMMPNLDGFGLVRALRAEPETAALPVILLSARAGEESSVEGLSTGADDYLVKPFSARELLARVRTHVELARVRRAWITRLEQANRELDAFGYSVSHDLRAPLRAIAGFSQAISEDYADKLDATGQDYLQRVITGAKRMGELIDALLQLARLARADVRRDTVDLSASANAVISDLRQSDPSRAVSANVEAGLVANCDQALVRIVLTNLIGNAWKFTARTGHPRIDVGRIANTEPAFFVRDNGAGFDMEYAGRLFSPFQRLHAASDFDGTGIGLATVQRVITRHGGRIWAEAAPGEGATFYFTLPEDNA